MTSSESSYNTRKTRTGMAIWRPDAILHIVMNSGAEETLDDAITNSKIGNDMAQAPKWGILIDARGLKSISKEARDYYAKNNETIGCTCVVILVESFYSKIIANFFLSFNKPEKKYNFSPMKKTL